MILVQNLLQRLNGNNILSSIVCLLGILGSSCASLPSESFHSHIISSIPYPKSYPYSTSTSHNLVGANAKISLLLPFKLNAISFNIDGTDPKNLIESNALIWDFYQGFIVGLDSIGQYNKDHGLKGIDLQVLDSEEDSLALQQILASGVLRESDFVVGPIYPAQIKQVTHYSILEHTYFVSPISPQPLSNYNNPNLIMVNSPLEEYSIKTAEFIKNHYGVSNILILDNSPQDKIFYSPMLSHFIYPPKVIKLSTSEINEQKIPLSQNLPNILIVPSLDKSFWSKLVVFLGNYSISNQITIFAHPNFSRINPYQPDLLQRFHVHYPSNFFLDKENLFTIDVQKLYKSKFLVNPNEYALLGFDIGYYFGKAATAPDPILNTLTNYSWKGVHNDFNFVKVPGTGYWNRSIKMLEFFSGGIREDQ